MHRLFPQIFRFAVARGLLPAGKNGGNDAVLQTTPVTQKPATCQPPDILAFAAKIVLHLVVIAREIKRQHALVRLENRPPRQTRAALVKIFAQLPYRQPAMRVRIAKTIPHQFQHAGHFFFFFPSGFPHDFFNRLDSSTEIIFASREWRQRAALARRFQFRANAFLRRRNFL